MKYNIGDQVSAQDGSWSVSYDGSKRIKLHGIDLMKEVHTVIGFGKDLPFDTGESGKSGESEKHLKEKYGNNTIIILGNDSKIVTYINRDHILPAVAKKEVKESNEFISVKDRLPDRAYVIVAHRFGVAEAQYYQGQFLNKDTRQEFTEVTHWMPMPKHPFMS